MSNKTKKESVNRTAEKTQGKKTIFLPFMAAAAVVVCAAALSAKYMSGSGGTSRENGAAVTVSYGEALVIPTADITEEASFFPVEVDGTNMEIIAVRDSSGNIRTAFNTCQICYDSGRGYYVQSGNYLVCQNCGSRFSTDQIEIESGGCNPWPIFEENKTVSDGEISISYDFLSQAHGIFENRKGSY